MSIVLPLVVLPAAELPVTKVIIYKNGVAYFERSGEVKPGESARLEFKTEEMDDVLKSLVVTGEGGGKVRSVRYELNEPETKRLADLPIVPHPEQALALLLGQMIGARVELKSATKSWSGVIVSGRMAALPQQGQRQELTLMLDSGELAVVELDAVSSAKLQDPKLEAQLKEALAVLASARSKDKRSVTIDAEGVRKILARYLVPAPVWKSSYRLVLPETGEATLEGWAIVDNASGEDWNNVELAVVSGKPVSFVMDLYEPKFLDRPHAELAESGPVAPQTYERAMAAPAPPPPAAKAPTRAAMMTRFAPGGGTVGGVVSGTLNLKESEAMISAADVQTETREEGELFEYRFSQPITAKKDESAMIPFVQQSIAAKKLLIYSPGSGPHPRSAAELTNITGKTLDGGPLTVYQSASYAGEALMETLKAGEKRLISYAVDLGTTVTTNFDSGTEVTREISASRGVVTTKSAIERTTTYTVSNVDNRDKALVIEHPVVPSMKLLRPKADETTPNRLRFNVNVPAKGSTKLAVVQEQVLSQTFSVSNYTPDNLVVLTQNKALPAAGRKQLETIIARKHDLAAVETELHDIETQTSEIARDQDRLRQNINTLRGVSGQQDMVQRYVQQLAQGDTELTKLRDRQAELRKQQTALESEINSLIEKLEF